MPTPPFPRFSILASALTTIPSPTAGCLVLISQKATLTSKLQTTRASLRQAEDRVSVANNAHRDLERLVQDLEASSDDAKTAESAAQSKVRELQAALVAETERAQERAKKLESARAAARADQAALDACRDDLDRRRERVGGRERDGGRKRDGSGFGARASRDDGADDWRDIITDIIHPSHLYDRKPKDGTSHHLSGDEEETRRRGSRRRTRRRRTGTRRGGSGRTIFRRDRSRYRSCGRRCDARAEGGGRFHPFAT